MREVLTTRLTVVSRLTKLNKDTRGKLYENNCSEEADEYYRLDFIFEAPTSIEKDPQRTIFRPLRPITMLPIFSFLSSAVKREYEIESKSKSAVNAYSQWIVDRVPSVAIGQGKFAKVYKARHKASGNVRKKPRLICHGD
eukprot:764569-Hanusia_phi.AAC.6